MAEINSSESNHKQRAGVATGKKLPTRIDLTPMVDLGFLLITFFIFTTTISQPTAMKLTMPDDKGTATPTKESGALTLIPSGNGVVYYYEGNLQNDNLTKATLMQMRNVIIDKKKRTASNDFFVIIKPSQSAQYGEIVSVLDEMTINDVKRHALVDITDKEQALVKE